MGKALGRWAKNHWDIWMFGQQVDPLASGSTYLPSPLLSNGLTGWPMDLLANN